MGKNKKRVGIKWGRTRRGWELSGEEQEGEGIKWGRTRRGWELNGAEKNGRELSGGEKNGRELSGAEKNGRELSGGEQGCMGGKSWGQGGLVELIKVKIIFHFFTISNTMYYYAYGGTGKGHTGIIHACMETHTA